MTANFDENSFSYECQQSSTIQRTSRGTKNKKDETSESKLS